MTSSAKPLAALPQVPTMDSLFPGSGMQGWHGIFAPAATPKDVVATFYEATRKVLASAETTAKLRELGLEPSGMGPERFAEVVRRDHERWGKLIRDNNIKAD
jgi:tripartite-type tricarboxylate transporter receptor subunit TctC